MRLLNYTKQCCKPAPRCELGTHTIRLLRRALQLLRYLALPWALTSHCKLGHPMRGEKEVRECVCVRMQTVSVCSVPRRIGLRRVSVTQEAYRF